MRKSYFMYLDDPPDLLMWGNSVFRLFLNTQILDFARRYYKRKGDKTSLKRSNELKKVIKKVYEMEVEASLALVSEEVLDAYFKMERQKEKLR